MASISGTVSTNVPMVARRTDKDGQIRSEQPITPPTGGYSFSTEAGDRVEIVEQAQAQPGDAAAPAPAPAAAA